MIAAVAGAVVAVPPAWEAMGLPEVASKVFVSEKIKPIEEDSKQIHLAQAATTKAVYQLTMIQLQNQLYQAMKDKVSAPSPTVDQQIEVLQDQIRDLQTKINQGQ